MTQDQTIYEIVVRLETKDCLPPDKNGVESCPRLRNPDGPAAIMVLRELRAEILALREALHDAINRPMGVVPFTADRFYDPKRAAVRSEDTPVDVVYRKYFESANPRTDPELRSSYLYDHYQRGQAGIMKPDRGARYALAAWRAGRDRKKADG